MNFNEDIKKIVEFIPKFEQLLNRLNKLESPSKQAYDDSEVRKLISESKQAYDDSEIRRLIEIISDKVEKKEDNIDKLEIKLNRMFDSFRNTEGTQSAHAISEFKKSVNNMFESFRNTESTQTAKALSLLSKKIDKLEKNNGKR